MDEQKAGRDLHRLRSRIVKQDLKIEALQLVVAALAAKAGISKATLAGLLDEALASVRSL